MNEKPDNLIRLLLVAIVLLLAAQLGIQWFYPVGRYVQFRGDTGEFLLGVLDTRTGTLYIPNKEKGGNIELNLVEAAKKKGTKP